MTGERRNMMKVGTKIGAALGAIVFAVFGILPGFYLGSYGAMMLVSRLSGGADAGVLMRMAAVAGILLGMCCIAAACIVLGSVFGTALAWVVDAIGSLGRAEDTADAHN